MQILIATPTYGGVGTEYIASTLRLQRYLLARGIGTGSAHHAMAEVSRSRNLLARLFLDQPEMTHLLFVDSDMSFGPEAVQALIDADKPLVGCVYPRRGLDLDRVIAAARGGASRERAIAAGLDFVIKPLGASIEVEGGLCRVRGVGMGLCLIARPVFEALAQTSQVKADPDLAAGRPVSGPVHGFFDPLPTPTGFLAEDLSFCERWIALCGGDVWAVVDQEIGHVGSMVYQARFSDVLYEV
jgi:hypothetical protein